MRTVIFLLCLCFLTLPAIAQSASATAAPPTPAPAASGSASMTSILPDLDRLQAAASQASVELGHMRIEKWKADIDSKRQAQANTDSVQRNLTGALPGLIDAVRSAPQDVSAEFKLYRNLNALYDVFVSVTESAGAFGPRDEYEALAKQVDVIDSVRRNLGNALENLTASTQSELAQLRTQVRALQQQAAAPPPAPKKVIVDDNEPPKKTAHKKKTAAKTAAAGSGSGPDSGSSGATAAPTPKQ